MGISQGCTGNSCRRGSVHSLTWEPRQACQWERGVFSGLWQLSSKNARAGGQISHKTKRSPLGVPLSHLHDWLRIQMPGSHPQLRGIPVYSMHLQSHIQPRSLGGLGPVFLISLPISIPSGLRRGLHGACAQSVFGGLSGAEKGS